MAERKDPFLGHSFKLKVDGGIEAQFQKVSGLTVETKVESFYEGGGESYPIFLFQKTEYSDIVLSRGLTNDDKLWKWYELAAWGVVLPLNGSILLLDAQGNTKATWSFLLGVLTKYEGPTLDAKSSEVAMETITIRHKGLSYKVS